MYPPLLTFKDNLKQSGHHLTAPRRQVFSTLLEQDALSMRELVHACSDYDRASIYRTVQLFEKLGIIRRLQMGWKYKLELSDDYQRHHHHMYCKRCGKVIPISGSSSIEPQLNRLAEEYDFRMLDHQLEIQGLCADCNLKTRNEMRPGR